MPLGRDEGGTRSGENHNFCSLSFTTAVTPFDLIPTLIPTPDVVDRGKNGSVV